MRENVTLEACDVVRNRIADSTAVDDLDRGVGFKSRELWRITFGYVAADLSTQSPTVDDDPIATIFSGSPDFKRAAVRGNCVPSEMFKFAERHLSAHDNSSCV